MVSQPDKTSDGDKRQEVVAADDRQYELAAELIELQRERHELARRYLEIDYDLSSKEIEIEDEQNKRSYRLVRLIVGGFAAVLFLLVYMVFYGSEAQSDNAMKILSEGAKALGGAGFVFLIYSGLKRLINR